MLLEEWFVRELKSEKKPKCGETEWRSGARRKKVFLLSLLCMTYRRLVVKEEKLLKWK